jgi:hydroxymethylglutaryl-CoA reductase
LRNLSPAERLDRVAEATSQDKDAVTVLGGGGLPVALANGMIENVIGTFELPIGVATNFTINGRDYLIPMAVEEPSVVAAASYMARIARGGGGFKTSSTFPVMRAQVQVLDLKDPHGARARILREREAIIAAANAKDKVLVALGGGGVSASRSMSSTRRPSGLWSPSICWSTSVTRWGRIRLTPWQRPWRR